MIPEKYRFILFGTYPFNEQWRPAGVCLIFIALFYLSSRRSWWRKELVAVWAAALVLIGVLMWGGIFGLSYVSQDRWGGLPVTLTVRSGKCPVSMRYERAYSSKTSVRSGIGHAGVAVAAISSGSWR